MYFILIINILNLEYTNEDRDKTYLQKLTPKTNGTKTDISLKKHLRIQESCNSKNKIRLLLTGNTDMAIQINFK
jgi:hypothetical protein